jgi:flagellar hook assembly protein FlgD
LHYISNGADKNGNRYPDGTYTIQVWIYGDDSTLVTKSYKLDLKGNGNATASKYIKTTRLEYPNDDSDFADYALYMQFHVVGHKGKKLRIRIRDAVGNELYSYTSSTQNKDDYYYGHFWHGKDPADGSRYPDGKYTIQVWIYGDDSTLVTKTYNLDLKGT